MKPHLLFALGRYCLVPFVCSPLVGLVCRHPTMPWALGFKRGSRKELGEEGHSTVAKQYKKVMVCLVELTVAHFDQPRPGQGSTLQSTWFYIHYNKIHG